MPFCGTSVAVQTLTVVKRTSIAGSQYSRAGHFRTLFARRFLDCAPLSRATVKTVAFGNDTTDQTFAKRVPAKSSIVIVVMYVRTTESYNQSSRVVVSPERLNGHPLRSLENKTKVSPSRLHLLNPCCDQCGYKCIYELVFFSSHFKGWPP